MAKYDFFLSEYDDFFRFFVFLFFRPPKMPWYYLHWGGFIFLSLKKKEIGSNRGSPPQTEFGLQFYTKPFKV
jgi:hypothetical protein